MTSLVYFRNREVGIDLKVLVFFFEMYKDKKFSNFTFKSGSYPEKSIID